MKRQFILSAVLLIFSISGLVSQPVSGTFTIGEVGKDFTTFTEAVDFLTERGIDGHVEVLVDPGEYDEQIKIDSITGSSADATISFTSSTGIKEDVRLHHLHQGWWTDANFTIYIDGADYLTFSNLTIEAVPESQQADDNNRVIYVTGGSDHITFRNNIIKSFITSEHYFEYNNCVVVGSDYNTSTKNNFFTFENNVVIGGANGFTFLGSQSAGDYGTKDLVIKNNKFIDQSTGGIEAWISQNLTIEDNEITAYKNSAIFWVGIEINQATGFVFVNRNNITSYNSGNGIYIASLDNNFLEGTKLVSNNSIKLNSIDSYNNNYGIQSSNNNNLIIAHNCIYQDENNNESILYYSQSQNAQIDNTVFVNNHLFHGSGGVCFRLNSAMIQTPFQDHNNYYSPNGSIALIGSDTIKNFIDFQNNGYEPNSSNIDPKFARTDFLVATNNLVFDSGTPTIVNEDQFGNIRSSTNPDIGIYEGVITDYDVGIVSFEKQNGEVCDLADNLSIVIKNFAAEELNTAVVKVRNASGEEISYSWSGSLMEGEESAPIIFDNLNLSQTDSPIAWTENPNQKPDVFTINDTMSFNYMQGMSGDYSVGDNNADYPSLNAAIDDLTENGICGPVTLNILPGIYDEEMYIPYIEGTSTVNSITIQSMSQDSTSVVFENTSS